MKMLVTGAAGFIGSHLAERLAGRGDTVVGIDNFNNYYDLERKRRNAEAVRQTGATVLEADIRDREKMLALFEEHRFDAVAHVAAMAGVRNSVANPALYMDVNLNGTQVLMDASREFGVQNFRACLNLINLRRHVEHSLSRNRSVLAAAPTLRRCQTRRRTFGFYLPQALRP